jgi:type I site-specific restriction endonuclease
MLMHKDNPFFGLEPISVYTTEQAIDDGFLVHPYPERWPWLLITSGVHGACETASEFDGRTYEQCLVPLLMDCIMQVQELMRQSTEGVSFAKLEHTVAGTVFIKPNDKGGMTVMLPQED